MDIVNLTAALAVLAGFFLTIYLANQQDALKASDKPLRPLWFGAVALAVVLALFTLQMAVITASEMPLPDDAALPEISLAAAVINALGTGLAALIAVRLIVSREMRVWLGRVVGGMYDPDSHVHTTAAVLCLVLLSVTISQFLLSGGVSGLAEIYAEGVRIEDVFFQQGVWIFVALLGVGLYIRRDAAQAFVRLGVRFPTAADWLWGLGAGMGGFALVIITGLLWTAVVTPEQLQEQTAASQQIAQSFGTLPQALVMSLAVAVGEELFFRGALQPVFGLWPTSLFFTALHTQYALTPATLALLGVSLMLGWVRRRHSTTTAMIGHFAYNFTQLGLAIWASSLLGA